jgi:phosphohistidine phosphatase
MKLYLVQHAKAAAKEIDPERGLTDEGLRELRKVAELIRPLNLGVDWLWHSGKKRAIQTAEILAEVMNVREGPTARGGLGPTDDVSVLRDELGSIDQHIMVVGHLPFLGKLASLLLAGSDSANVVAFKNGGIVCLDRAELNQWQIEWVVTPEILV